MRKNEWLKIDFELKEINGSGENYKDLSVKEKDVKMVSAFYMFNFEQFTELHQNQYHFKINEWNYLKLVKIDDHQAFKFAHLFNVKPLFPFNL